MIRTRIVAVGGLSRSGTNYFCYSFFLHPDMRGLTYISKQLLTPKVNNGSVHDHKSLYDWWYQQCGGKMRLLPWFQDDSEGEFREYHDQQNEKTHFEAVCFKDDAGEVWFKDVLHRIKSRCLVVYCVRADIAGLWRSWKKWGGPTGVGAEKWITFLRHSVESAYELKKQANRGLIDFETVTFNCPHEKVASQIINISNKYLGGVGEWQLKFLEKRRPIAFGISTFHECNQSDEELMAELRAADPGLNDLIGRYTSLVKEWL